MIYNVRVTGHLTTTRSFYQEISIEAETEEEAIDTAQDVIDDGCFEWIEDTEPVTSIHDTDEIEFDDAEVVSSASSNSDEEDSEDE